ncbi:MAG: ATP-dependent DNA helicase RecG [Candidatus Daviesbacteria bacterium]|nr:ATP-dependent DNA helicase RecG [Candidatus Daviesbacteria bacterium]
MDLSTKLVHTSGIGPSLQAKLDKLNLTTVEDLVTHYPFRYEDFAKISKIAEARAGEIVTFSGDVLSIKNTYTKSHKILTKAILNDGSGSVEIIWFNNRWIIKNIKVGDKIQTSGKLDFFAGKLGLIAPEWEKVDINQALHTGRLVPVYPETYGLTSKWLRAKIHQFLPQITPTIVDPIPVEATKDFLPLAKALEKIHFPDTYSEILQAKKRLSFDELFYIQLSTLKKREDWQNKQVTKAFKIDKEKLQEFIDKLPFKLTKAQDKVIQEVLKDVNKTSPANRLIQGEVGSGKTVVAAVIIYLAYLNGLKSLLMAPTEILAFQHNATLTKLLEPFGISVGLYTGSKKFTNIPDVIVGTHALLSEKLELNDIGLIVVDEQQRFGVAQRSLLRARAKSPHFITMTATPIPRTVALTIYGDLDLSVIDEMPVGRLEVKTHYVPEIKREDSYKFMEKVVQEGQQIYIITPLIDESETLVSAKAAKAEFEKLQTKIFPNLKLGLLHGKLKPKEKEEVINAFKNHKIDILVSTSVVEVGMDIPNATIMVIEGAERFGLSQLHQLRGRVGRGNLQSYCFLFAEQEIPQVISRLKNLEHIHDGLKLAELDLQIRGSGEIFGTRQSGDWDLKIASLSNLELIEQARNEAKKILQDDLTLDKHQPLLGKLLNLENIMPD